MAWYNCRYTIDVHGNSYTITMKNRKFELHDLRLPKETERTLKALVKGHGVYFALAAVARAQKQIRGKVSAVSEVDTDELGL